MDRDLSHSRAILIGNGNYLDPGIHDLPAARACVSAMTDLLTSDLCGWPPDRITELLDIAAPHDLARRIVNAVKDARDVLFVYYIGHGMPTHDGQLALTVGETDHSPEALPHTAMLYPNLARILSGCTAATKLVILDCCHAEYAHRANSVFQSSNLAEAYPVDGLYFIGASKKYDKAIAPIDGTLTYFTSAFVDVVRKGMRGWPPVLRLDQIFLQLRADLTGRNLPEPVESGTRGAHYYPFARNAAPVGDPPANHTAAEDALLNSALLPATSPGQPARVALRQRATAMFNAAVLVANSGTEDSKAAMLCDVARALTDVDSDRATRLFIDAVQASSLVRSLSESGC